MRIAIAEVAQETDSFSPIRTELDQFETYGLYFGNEILEKTGGAGPLGGFLEVAAEQPGDVELVPIVRAWASAGGIITSETFEFLKEKLISGLKAAMPLDAVYLSLHGAASVESDDDLEGNILQAVREVVGDAMPVVVPLDHHANVTQRMFECADALVGHETQPHDPPATGRKAAGVLFEMMNNNLSVSRAWRKIPLITPQDQFLTARGPMKEWFDLAREMEMRPGVIDVSPYPMQPWLDVLEGGWAVVVHTAGDQSLAESLADEIATKAWELREEFFRSERVAPAEAVRQADAAKSGLIILSDTGDSVYGGAPGDSTCILKAMLAENVSSLALVPMIDPEAVDAAFAAGQGSEVTLSIGGKQDNVFSSPVEVTGRVSALSEGETIEVEKRGGCELGRVALLEVGAIRIALMDRRSFAINHPALYETMGLSVADAKMVVVKTASNFQFFDQWRKGLIRVDSPGMTQSDLAAFDWKHLPRPIYPLDELAGWEPSGD